MFDNSQADGIFFPPHLSMQLFASFANKMCLTPAKIASIMVGMEKKTVKIKLNQLLKTYPGPKMDRYKAAAKDLHVKSRTIQYLATGKFKANFYIAREIDALLEKRNGSA